MPGAVQGSWNEHSTLEGKDVAVVLCYELIYGGAAQLHCQQGNFPSSFVATLWNISSDVPEPYKRDWRLERLFLKVLCG